jgi:drug/metabolite transporter (DMT)-like permease
MIVREFVPHKRKNAVLFAIVAAVLYAFSVPLSKPLLEGVPAWMLAGLMYLGVGIGVGGLDVVLTRMGRMPHYEPVLKKDMPFIVGMVLLDILAPVLLMTGLSRTAAANASLLNNFEIVATALIALLLFHETVSRRLWIAIALVTLASCLLTMEDSASFSFSVGSLYILLAAACWGLENNCTRMLSEKNPLHITTIKGLCSGAGALIIGVLLGQRITRTAFVAPAMLLGFFTYGLSIVFYIRAQRDIGAARTSAYYAAAPFVSVLISFIVLRERPNVAFFAALALMAAGVYFATFEARKRERKE